MKNLFMTLALVIGVCTSVSAQVYCYETYPKPDQKIIGDVIVCVDTDDCEDNHEWYRTSPIKEALIQKAGEEYGNKYPKFDLYNYKVKYTNYGKNYNKKGDYCIALYKVSATVVIPAPHLQLENNLSASIEKALKNIGEGSRIAVKQITIEDNAGLDEEKLKDKIVNILLDKGYRIVAKEYLAQLYDEWKNQRTGIFNPDQIVEENNFSAVGYYFNLKVSTTSMRVQLINVSTGEYEGNVTVNF